MRSCRGSPSLLAFEGRQKVWQKEGEVLIPPIVACGSNLWLLILNACGILGVGVNRYGWAVDLLHIT